MPNHEISRRTFLKVTTIAGTGMLVGCSTHSNPIISTPNVEAEDLGLFVRISKDNNMPLVVSDFLDFSIYIDAEEPSLRTWYTDRFLSLRQAALNNEEDFFNRFSSINDDQAKEIANSMFLNLSPKLDDKFDPIPR